MILLRHSIPLIIIYTSAAASPAPVALVETEAVVKSGASSKPSPTSSACHLIKPTPSGVVCGVRGDPSDPRPYRYDYHFDEYQHGISLQKCAYSCLNRNYSPDAYDFYYETTSECTGFSYAIDSGLCALYQYGHIRETLTQNSTGSRLFYDAKCFQCPSGCPQKGSKNLISDGGFEESDEYVGPWFTSPGQNMEVVSPGDMSKTAIFCASNHVCELSQYRRVCAHQLYTYSFDYKINSSAELSKLGNGLITFSFGGMEIRLSFDWEAEYQNPSGWQTMYATAQGEGETDYTYVTVYHYAPKTVLTCYGQTNSSSGGVYFDNFRLIPAPAVIPTTGDSLLENGGFETGQLSPWKVANTDLNYYFGDVHPGKHNITSPGLAIGSKYAFLYHGGTAASFNLFQPAVPVKKGAAYLISFDYKSTEFFMTVSTNYTNSNTLQSYGYDYVDDFAPEEVVTYQRVFTALDDEVQVIMSFVGDPSEDKKGKNYVDNISLKEVLSS